jgi:hypothetical protein
VPVIGRFRLRRESRRAFLRSWIRFISFAEEFNCEASAEVLGEAISFRQRSIDPLFNVLIRISLLHAQQALHLRRAECVH